MKQMFTMLFVAILLGACDAPKSENLAAAANEKLIRQFYEHFNRHDWEKMAGMYAETADFRDPSLGQGIVRQTRQQTIKKYAELNQLFPDLKDSIRQVYPSSDKHIIVEFVSKGTAADGSAFELPICTIFTIENGQITKDFTYYDNFEEPEQ
jgi:steroid delta-isomerase-like uncharacterized protein